MMVDLPGVDQDGLKLSVEEGVLTIEGHVKRADNKEYLIDISDSAFVRLNQEIYEYTKGQKRLVVMSKKVYKLYSSDLNFSDDDRNGRLYAMA